jgi:hypothetical protein
MASSKNEWQERRRMGLNAIFSVRRSSGKLGKREPRIDANEHESAKKEISMKRIS